MAMPTTRTALTVAGNLSTVPRRTAAREMRREGHRVVVFERGDTVGGTWVYTPEVSTGGLGNKFSHNYRVPKPFQGKVVVLIGSAASATDISRDIAPVAKEAHASSRSASDETTKRQPGYNNMGPILW